MPARYEALRDKFVNDGMSIKAAKTKAAKIYNATKKRGEPSLHRRVRAGLKRAFPSSE